MDFVYIVMYRKRDSDAPFSVGRVFASYQAAEWYINRLEESGQEHQILERRLFV